MLRAGAFPTVYSLGSRTVRPSLSGSFHTNFPDAGGCQSLSKVFLGSIGSTDRLRKRPFSTVPRRQFFSVTTPQSLQVCNWSPGHVEKPMQRTVSMSKVNKSLSSMTYEDIEKDMPANRNARELLGCFYSIALQSATFFAVSMCCCAWMLLRSCSRF